MDVSWAWPTPIVSRRRVEPRGIAYSVADSGYHRVQPEWIALPGCAFLAGCPVSVLEAARLLTARQITQDRTRFEVRHWRQPTTAEVAMEAGVARIGSSRCSDTHRSRSRCASHLAMTGTTRSVTGSQANTQSRRSMPLPHRFCASRLPGSWSASMIVSARSLRLRSGLDWSGRRTPRRGRGLLRAHPRANRQTEARAVSKLRHATADGRSPGPRTQAQAPPYLTGVPKRRDNPSATNQLRQSELVG